MSINFSDDVAIFDSNCRVEDAELLREWLERHPNGKVDLLACENLHTAVLQILLIAKPAVKNPPDNVFLQRWLLPYLS